MKSIHIINELDGKIEVVFKSALQLIEEKLNDESESQTLKASVGLTSSLNKIKCGILALSDSKDDYSIHILFRAHIEHFLTSLYLHYKFERENSNLVGIEYLVSRLRKEEFDYWKGIKKIPKILGFRDLCENTEKQFKEKYPEFTSELYKQLSRDMEQWKIESMMKYFLSDIDINNIASTQSIPQMNPVWYYEEWALLSSYVHGGPYANKLSTAYKTSEQLSQRILRICNHVYDTSIRSKFMTIKLASICFRDARFFKMAMDIINIDSNNGR